MHQINCFLQICTKRVVNAKWMHISFQSSFLTALHSFLNHHIKKTQLLLFDSVFCTIVSLLFSKTLLVHVVTIPRRYQIFACLFSKKECLKFCKSFDSGQVRFAFDVIRGKTGKLHKRHHGSSKYISKLKQKNPNICN